eukprot:2433773-Rhodomonas_salina.1
MLTPSLLFHAETLTLTNDARLTEARDKAKINRQRFHDNSKTGFSQGDVAGSSNRDFDDDDW